MENYVPEVVWPKKSTKYSFIHIQIEGITRIRFSPEVLAENGILAHMPIATDLSREFGIGCPDMLKNPNRGGGFAFVDIESKTIVADGKSGLMGEYDHRLVRNVCESGGWHYEERVAV